VASTDDEGVVDLSAKGRRRAKAASGYSATAELKARQKAKEARQSEEDVEEHADEKEGEDADEDEESEEEEQPPPKRQKKMVSCTECGLALKPSDKRYRTTRAHHACGLACKKMQYALTQSGGAEAAKGLKMFKTKKKEEFHGFVLESLNEKSHGLSLAMKDKLIKACDELHKTGGLENKDQDEYVDMTEYAQEMTRRRGGTVQQWRKDFKTKVKNG
jgi:hypothetical protein